MRREELGTMAAILAALVLAFLLGALCGADSTQYPPITY